MVLNSWAINFHGHFGAADGHNSPLRIRIHIRKMSFPRAACFRLPLLHSSPYLHLLLSGRWILK